ncbi:MAG TPA: 2-keto-4-pentenoate hydratase [Micromonosporaceae bacterium]
MTDLEGIATELLDAYDSRITVAPLSGTYEGLTLDDAYEIQQIQVRRRIADGASVIGYKVGLTSAAMQQQLGVYEPDYGHLLADMLYPADAPIPVARFLQPRAEPEIALVLAHPLRTPGRSVTDIVSATAYAVPAIEIIDSRITDWRIGLYDTIADNASSAALVLGQTPRPIDRLDLSLAGCVFRRNGRIVQTGAGAAVLGSPLHAATWLANTLTARGVELAAGSVILTGSLTAAIPVVAGDAVTATIDHLGAVTAVFD